MISAAASYLSPIPSTLMVAAAAPQATGVVPAAVEKRREEMEGKRSKDQSTGGQDRNE